MRGLNHQLKTLCKNNREGSYGTQVQRERDLTLIANQLHELGYRGINSHSLKPKHVEALVGHWVENEVTTGTIKNRMSAVRWWARKVNRQNVVARSNDFYGIPNRTFVTNTSQARVIPIRTEKQREVLNRAHKLAGKGSLIPSARNYVQQVRIYDGNTIRAGLSKMHGLRHAYAQQRYEELTGWKSPAAGGPISKALSAEQREKDYQVRLVISREMGHEREQVTAVYLGR